MRIPSPRPFHLKKPLFALQFLAQQLRVHARGKLKQNYVKAARSRFKTTLSVAYFFSSLISFFELSGHFDKVSKRYVDNLTVLQSPIALARWQRLRENSSFALFGKIENGKNFRRFCFFLQEFWAHFSQDVSPLRLPRFVVITLLMRNIWSLESSLRKKGQIASTNCRKLRNKDHSSPSLVKVTS